MEYTRITNRYTSESVVQNLLSNRSKLVDLQQQISSGKRITIASDDVLAGISLVSANNSLGKLDNYLKNIDNAQNEVDTADQALSTAIDSVHKTRELTIQALNASSGTQEMTLINAQIKQIVEQIKDIGNTQYGTKFIFGGLKTDPTPFTSPVDGEVNYTGSADGSHERLTEISDRVTVPVNLSGEELFGYCYTGDHDNDPATPDTLDGQGLFKTLITLSAELGAVNPDKDVIREKLDDLEGDLQTLLEGQSKAGGLAGRLEMTKTSLQDNQLSLTKIKSGAEDIDLAKAISDLQFQQTSLEASLQVSAKIIQPSLLSYM